MWRNYGSRQRSLKPVDPIALVSSSIRERNAKESKRDHRVKTDSNILESDLPLSFKTSNKTFALHQLVSDLSKDDFALRVRALRELPEILENPLYAEASIDLKIIDKLALLQKRYGKRLLTPRSNEDSLILKLFQILSTYLKAAEQMAAESYLIASLYRMILTMHRDQHIAATILKNLSEKPKVLEILLKLPKIMKSIKPILQRELCTTYYPKDLWLHFQHVLAANPERGVQENLLETFLYRAQIKINDYHLDNMQCLGILLKCPKGQSQFQASNGLSIFYEILSPKTPDLDDYQPILQAFKNALQNNHSMIEDCAKFNDFPDILVNLAKNTSNSKEQTLALQILNALNTREDIRYSTSRRCKKSINTMRVLSKEAEYYKLALICCFNKDK